MSVLTSRKPKKKKRQQYGWEAFGLAVFACYEISVIVTLKVVSALPGSHLEYLVGVRNKILIHARRDAFVKNSPSGLTLGPILLPHVVGASGWDYLLREQYLQDLKVVGGLLPDDDAGKEANVRLIRSGKKVENFTMIDSLRLKSYVIPEPDLLESAVEMAAQLEIKFLPEIRRACRPF